MFISEESHGNKTESYNGPAQVWIWAVSLTGDVETLLWADCASIVFKGSEHCESQCKYVITKIVSRGPSLFPIINHVTIFFFLLFFFRHKMSSTLSHINISNSAGVIMLVNRSAYQMLACQVLYVCSYNSLILSHTT